MRYAKVLFGAFLIVAPAVAIYGTTPSTIASAAELQVPPSPAPNPTPSPTPSPSPTPRPIPTPGPVPSPGPTPSPSPTPPH
jgi:hypothetical protein